MPPCVEDFLSGVRVPQLDRPIRSGPGEPAAIRAKGHTHETTVTHTGERADLPTGRRVPGDHLAGEWLALVVKLAACADELLAVGTERQAVNSVRVAFQCDYQQSGG